MLRSIRLTLLALLAAAPLAAQEDSDLAAVCARGDLLVPGAPGGAVAEARRACFTAAQAVESAQPQLGILLSGGNPTLGAASTGGLRMGVLPRVSASLRANVVFVHLPDLLAGEGGTFQDLNESVGLPVPALAGGATLGVFPGIDLAPTVGGIGSIDLLGSATWLPFSAFDVEGFGEEVDDFSFGVGARVGLLRESFTTPGLSLSVMRRSLGEVRYGEVCGSAIQPALREGSFEAGFCPEPGDAGEFAFDLTSWSTRAAIGKRLAGIGLTGGVGYDTFDSDVDLGFRVEDGYFARARDVAVDNDRWSAFGNLSFTALVATFALEAGWMQGADPIAGFDAASDFDPADGTLFGSVGLRLSF